MKVSVFDIKRYAINDGPGIRTTIFMKGCPLRCVWCHNPESWEVEPEVLFKQSKCIGCNTCGLLPILNSQFSIHNSKPEPKQRLSITNCHLSIENCPAMALERCGKEWTMEELMAEIEKERDVMVDSGGGVTLCGGEPLMQPQAALALLKELGRRGFHRTVDTSLYASAETVKAIAAETDLFLVDLKHMDSERHRQLTGVGNELILENVKLLTELKANIWFRVPLIEGVNADEENIEATAQFIASLRSSDKTIASQLSTLITPDPQPPILGGSNLSPFTPQPFRVHLLPYHDIGKDKHRRRGTVYNPDHIQMTPPSAATIERCRQQFERHGFHVVVGG